MAAGYIYVLVNSAMPGLIKIGKTTRQPSNRAEELSSSTAIATPFILAFEHFFENCDEAEYYIHHRLTQAGFRESQNREFFRIGVTDAVHIILSLSSDTNSKSIEDNKTIPAEKCQQNYSGRKSNFAWSPLLNEADNYYEGEGYFPQDHYKALELYKNAAILGSLLAYERLGDIYKNSTQIPFNFEMSRRFLWEGINKGNYYCYLEMAALFLDKRQRNNNNFYKYFRLFVLQRQNAIIAEVEEYERRPQKFAESVAWYVYECTKLRICIEHIGLVGDKIVNVRRHLQDLYQEAIIKAETSQDADRVSFSYQADLIDAAICAIQSF